MGREVVLPTGGFQRGCESGELFSEVLDPTYAPSLLLARCSSPQPLSAEVANATLWCGELDPCQPVRRRRDPLRLAVAPYRQSGTRRDDRCTCEYERCWRCCVRSALVPVGVSRLLPGSPASTVRSLHGSRHGLLLRTWPRSGSSDHWFVCRNLVLTLTGAPVRPAGARAKGVSHQLPVSGVDAVIAFDGVSASIVSSRSIIDWDTKRRDTRCAGPPAKPPTTRPRERLSRRLLQSPIPGRFSSLHRLVCLPDLGQPGCRRDRVSRPTLPDACPRTSVGERARRVASRQRWE